MKNHRLKLALFAFVLFNTACAPVVAPTLPAANQANFQQNQLIGPLTQALSSALNAAQQAQTPTEARQLALTRFYDQIAELFQGRLQKQDVQVQVQSQWTSQRLIQVQIQSQIADAELVAQAQRQTQFQP